MRSDDGRASTSARCGARRIVSLGSVDGNDGGPKGQGTAISLAWAGGISVQAEYLRWSRRTKGGR